MHIGLIKEQFTIKHHNNNKVNFRIELFYISMLLLLTPVTRKILLLFPPGEGEGFYELRIHEILPSFL